MICLICNRKCNGARGLNSHLKHHHMGSKEYYDKYLKKEGEGICKHCKQPTKFYSVSTGYSKTCVSLICRGLEISDAKQNFSEEKNQKINKKREQTNLKKYGKKHVFQTDLFDKKAKQTKLERYGDPTYTNPKKIGETYRKNNANGKHSNNTWRKRKENNRQFEIENNCTSTSTLIAEYGQGWLSLNLPRMHRGKQHTFISNEYLPLIQQYAEENHSTWRSKGEIELVEFVNNIYTGQIEENSRKIISPLELDIYIPDKKVAIEFNGVYWHSTNIGTDKNQHLLKTKMCEEQNIRLIHLTDWEWVNKQDICKSIIKSALGLSENRIYARDCKVKEVSRKKALEFLETNHIQGKLNSSYRLGLYYNNELVQLITLGKSRFKKGEYELLRMCSKLNTQVVGGFSKLLSHQPYNVLFSYIDRAIFSGNAYEKCGFELISETKPSYAYYNSSNIKLNRVSAQKHKLPELLGDKFDPEKTETDNMVENNWWQVYDCGTFKVRWER